jgi:hypothetical protein
MYAIWGSNGENSDSSPLCNNAVWTCMYIFKFQRNVLPLPSACFYNALVSTHKCTVRPPEDMSTRVKTTFFVRRCVRPYLRVWRKENRWHDERFQVLAAASMKFRIVFWDVLPCKIIVDRRFRGTCCLHEQGSFMEAARTSETSVDNY